MVRHHLSPLVERLALNAQQAFLGWWVCSRLITAVHHYNRAGDKVRDGKSGYANTIYRSTIWRQWGMLHPEAHDVRTVQGIDYTRAQHEWAHKFSKVLSTLNSQSTYTRGLTFEILPPLSSSSSSSSSSSWLAYADAWVVDKMCSVKRMCSLTKMCSFTTHSNIRHTRTRGWWMMWT